MTDFFPLHESLYSYKSENSSSSKQMASTSVFLVSQKGVIGLHFFKVFIFLKWNIVKSRLYIKIQVGLQLVRISWKWSGDDDGDVEKGRETYFVFCLGKFFSLTMLFKSCWLVFTFLCLLVLESDWVGNVIIGGTSQHFNTLGSEFWMCNHFGN